MLAFGLGTFPAMLAMGGIGRVLAPVWRQRGVWLAGSLILLIGVVTVGRGIVPLSAHHSTPRRPRLKRKRSRRHIVPPADAE